MAPVLHVALPGQTSAILKLYDGRFGTSLGRNMKRKHGSCCLSDERAFEDFVHQCSMTTLLREIEEEELAEGIPSKPAGWTEAPDGQAKFEAALWLKARE
jgi:hypothetical protein